MKNLLKKRPIGSRIVKTGIAVFITAAICLALNMPAVFAVITAIVTIEPTASDSIKKGLIRFPASAIGAALAVFFAALFGETALTYMLAAGLTIYICQLFNLHVGTLVAVITAVAMIPDIQDNYFLTFLTRLGTTGIGLTVSTAVNFFLLPPKFIKTIEDSIGRHIISISNVLEETVTVITSDNQDKSSIKSYERLRNALEKTNDFIFYQEMEWKYHKVRSGDKDKLELLKAQMDILQQMTLHLGQLQYIDCPMNLNKDEKDLIMETASFVRYELLHLDEKVSSKHVDSYNKMDEYLMFNHGSNHQKNLQNPQFIHDKTIVFYAILSIQDLLAELHKLSENK